VKRLILKKGREKAALRRHPWIFSGAVEKVEGDPQMGETVRIFNHHGQFLAQGAYSPTSQIRARIWTWDETETIDRDFFHKRLQDAVALREAWVHSPETSAYRLVHAESDNLPGLVVDQYDQTLIIQILSAGMERWRDLIVEILAEMLHPECIFERSDVAVRELEGLKERIGVCYGALPGQPMVITENGLKFQVDLVTGQKTGFYLDQRANRLFCQGLAGGKSVLNCFAFTGGFTVYSLAGGAKEILSIDSSEEAITMAQDNVRLNQQPIDKCRWIIGDVFEELRTLRDKNEQYDLVILDPPKFAPTSSQAKSAARGYKDINLYAFKLLKPGGVLMTYSCSGGINEGFFQKIVADAALDAEVDARILYRLSQAPDHPTHLAFPEGSYLKGLVVEIGK
jgi:23S rRNA (cytosine1962-C5)-methyltransferase